MTETEALELLRQGKEIDQAFQVLVDPLLERLLDYLTRMTGNREDARDLRQLTLITGFRHIRQFDPTKASLYTWLGNIALRHWMHTRRKRGREAVAFGRLVRSTTEPADDPEEAFLAHLRHEELWKLLKQLSIFETCAVVMHWAEGKSFKVIGQALGISARMAKRYAWRGMHLLRMLYHLTGLPEVQLQQQERS